MKKKTNLSIIILGLLVLIISGCMSSGIYIRDFMNKEINYDEHAYLFLQPGFTVQNYDGNELFQFLFLGHRPWGSGALIDDIAVLPPGEHKLIVTSTIKNFGRMEVPLNLYPGRIYELRYVLSNNGNSIRFQQIDRTIDTNEEWIEQRNRISNSFGVSWGAYEKNMTKNAIADFPEEWKEFVDAVIKAVYFSNDMIGLTQDELKSKINSDRLMEVDGDYVISMFPEMVSLSSFNFENNKIYSVVLFFGEYDEVIETLIVTALVSKFGINLQEESGSGSDFIGIAYTWFNDLPSELFSVSFLTVDNNGIPIMAIDCSN